MFARSAHSVTLPALAATLLAASLAACSATPNGQGNNTYTQYLPDGQFIGNDTGGGGTQDSTGGGTDNPGEDTTGGTGGGQDTTTVTPGGGPYVSPELRVRIVGPSGRGHAVVSGAIIEVAGVVFGNADSITWSTDTGGSGSAHGAPFFQSDPITLVPGDNVVTVTAKNATEQVTDTLVVTYNPVFQFQDRLRANPGVVKVGKNTSINATIAVGKATNVLKGSVKLFRVDANNGTMTTFGVMEDDGALGTSGDEIKGDGIYSRKINVSESQPGSVRLRASVQVNAGTQTITAYSDVLVIDAVKDITSAECNEVLGALKSAKNAGDQAAILAALKSNPAVADAGETPGTGVWVRFNSGLLGAVNVRKEGNRGGGDAPAAGDSTGDPNLALSTVQVQSKRALLLDPSAGEFGKDEIAAFGDTLKATACPAYTVDMGKGASADLHYYRQMYLYGITAMANHGDANFGTMDAGSKSIYDWQHPGSQETVWTGHAVSCNYFGANGANPGTCSESQACGPESECVINQTGGNGVCVDHLTADLRRGRVIFGSDGTYGILPGFIRRHATETYPKSLVYMGGCRSLYNGSMAGELFAAGAAAVSGFTGPVRNEFATQWGTTFLTTIVADKKLSGVAHVQIGDTGNPGTQFSLVGAQNLDAFFSDIINPSWETGNLQGWIKSGDGRVISRLGSTVPVGGKFMGIISTGLGYTAQTGEINQRFCIPEGKTKASFWWKYYSEEFKEYCGSTFQDAFTGRFEGMVAGKAANITLVSAKVDDLCDGGPQYKGLTPADVGFDQGGVYMTPWVQSTKDISPFAGKGAVLLRFFASDVGDSIYDTAVLVDKVEFN
ncbi:MAG: hypothetical protein HY902_08085 [Deltaproteobacteria bacterium]|nr:hypothetical protein [Deltaproteobacteria bacterium]